MDTFDRFIIVLMIIGSTLASIGISSSITNVRICESSGGRYSDGVCIKKSCLLEDHTNGIRCEGTGNK